jgi:hypothetical protein
MVADIDPAPAVEDDDTVTGTAIYTPHSLASSPAHTSADDYFSATPSRYQRPSPADRRGSSSRSAHARTRQASYSSTSGARTPGTITTGRRRRYDDLHEKEELTFVADDTALLRRKERKQRPLERLHTETLLRMVLQDAQTRLVFRAQAMLVSEVEYYAIKDGDLEYPEKLGSGECGALPRVS